MGLEPQVVGQVPMDQVPGNGRIQQGLARGHGAHGVEQALR